MAAGIHSSHRVPVRLMGQHPRLGFHKATPRSRLCRAQEAQAPGRRQLVCRLCYRELFNNVRATPSSLVIQTQSAVCRQRVHSPDPSLWLSSASLRPSIQTHPGSPLPVSAASMRNRTVKSCRPVCVFTCLVSIPNPTLNAQAWGLDTLRERSSLHW